MIKDMLFLNRRSGTIDLEKAVGLLSIKTKILVDKIVLLENVCRYSLIKNIVSHLCLSVRSTSYKKTEHSLIHWLGEIDKNKSDVEP